MMISNRGPAAPAPTYAQTMQARDAAKAAKAQEKRMVAQNVAQALNSARMDAPERAKRDAKAKLIEIAKRVQLLKKLFAGNPKEMARALTQVFKELRAAVKAYKDAGGAELGLAGDAAKGAVANDVAPKADDAPPEAKAGEAPVEAETAQAEPEEKPPEPDQAAASGSAVYDAVVGNMRKAIGEDGLDFVKMVRQLVNGANGLRDMLEAARTQAKGKKPDKDTDEAFEDADKEMKALADDMATMEREIRNAVPEAGMKLSIDA
jgi:hypothetical protein